MCIVSSYICIYADSATKIASRRKDGVKEKEIKRYGARERKKEDTEGNKKALWRFADTVERREFSVCRRIAIGRASQMLANSFHIVEY